MSSQHIHSIRGLFYSTIKEHFWGKKTDMQHLHGTFPVLQPSGLPKKDVHVFLEARENKPSVHQPNSPNMSLVIPHCSSRITITNTFFKNDHQETLAQPK